MSRPCLVPSAPAPRHSRPHAGLPLLVLLPVYMLSAPPPTVAREWIVAKDGSGEFTSVADAADSAASGDTLYVRAGIYDDRVTFLHRKSLSIIGEPSGLRPEIRRRLSALGEGDGQLILTHLAFVGISDADGPWLTVNSYGRVHLEDCRAESNVYGNVIGICDRVSVTRCQFVNNGAANDWSGGALSIGVTDRATISWCTFIGNSTSSGVPGDGDRGGGGALYVSADPGGTAIVEHCYFEGNSAPSGGAATVRGEYIFRQNTVIRNTSQDGALMTSGQVSPPAEVYANVFAWNNGYGFWDNDANPYCWCNVYWQNTGAGGIFGNQGQMWGLCRIRESTRPPIFIVDPQFCDPAIGNYGLTDTSPLLPENRDIGEDDCELTIGAYEVDCNMTPPAIEARTWGAIKLRYAGAERHEGQ